MSIRPLTPELAAKAQKELNEDPKRIPSDLEHIKDWLAKQPHIYARTDDQWLIAFLRGCKYSLERTKEKLDLYYTLRTITPELYTFKPDNPKFDEFMDSGAYVLMPKTETPDSPRLAIMRNGMVDPERITMIDVFGAMLIIQKIVMLEDDNSVVSGIKFICDLEGITMAHMLQITPNMMKKMSVQSQDAVPLRMKGAHYINCPAAFEKIINLMKTMLNEKNKSRLYVHGKNYDALYQHIPKHLLPAEYGGEGGSIKEIADYWKAKRRQYSSWLEEDMKYKTDESKRPGKPKTAESMFGIEGSFRQLEFD
ncbi:alpha-tocopherol transfer protein-like [Bicyclus anynana]|uniref:Alpha-tocopherol transfer protein-like n=1 Tax=Bicyclus anynana TaxID=110368 RepID=A0A6J1P5K7_BICAN|nr:alpha-tocopherol transfer protein-like [Bicyclus anynana]